MLRHAARLGGRAFKAGATRAPLQAAAARAFRRLPRRVQAVVAISAPLRQAGLPGLALPSAARPPLAPALWQAYLQSLQQRPLVTKAATSFALTLISDSVAQVLGGVAGYSIWRCVRLGLYSATVGALSGHYWHRHLDRACYPHKPRSVQAVGSKLALDQLLYTPVMTSCFLAFLKVAEGQPHLALPFIQEKLGATLLAGYTVWPAVNIITFRYVPQDLRILFCSIVGLFWGTFMSLSCVNSASGGCLEPGVQVAAAQAQGSASLQAQ